MSQSTLSQFLEQIQAQIHAINQRLDRIETQLAEQSLQQMSGAASQRVQTQPSSAPVATPAADEPLAAHPPEPVSADDWLKSKLKVTDQSPLLQKVMSSVERKVNRYSFYTWFKNIQIASDEGDTVTISVPDELAAGWLQKRYGKLLEDALAEAGRTGVNVKVVSRDPTR